MDADAIFFSFRQESVLACDFTGFLKHFDEERLPAGPALKRMQGRLHLTLEGFDDDSREIYEIPEVRRFYARFLEAFPHWLFFMSLEEDGLKVMVGSVLGDLTALRRDGSDQVQVSFDAMEVLKFVSSQLPNMNRLCDHAGMTEPEIEGLTYRVLAYLGLPAERLAAGSSQLPN
jgi:hypothetical protein